MCLRLCRHEVSWCQTHFECWKNAPMTDISNVRIDWYLLVEGTDCWFLTWASSPFGKEDLLGFGFDKPPAHMQPLENHDGSLERDRDRRDDLAGIEERDVICTESHHRLRVIPYDILGSIHLGLSVIFCGFFCFRCFLQVQMLCSCCWPFLSVRYLDLEISVLATACTADVMLCSRIYQYVIVVCIMSIVSFR